jgi:8-amino-7-oxononanoate synthase
MPTALDCAIGERFKTLGQFVPLSIRVPLADVAVPTASPDLFSNDYLSLTTNEQLKHLFLSRLLEERIPFGSTGSRLLTGNTTMHLEFEARMAKFFGGQAALLCNSGYEANTAFFSAIPAKQDIIFYDSLVHASILDGIASSSARSRAFPFKHNHLLSLADLLQSDIVKESQINQGKTTVFIVVESMYSMDGDFCPLQELVDIAEAYIPAFSLHIIVDEAHTTGVYGDAGRGIVHDLGLTSRVDTVLHTFGKGRAFSGGESITL